MAHILVVPVPIQGHINPMLRLSLELASMEHKVTFVTTTGTQSQAEEMLNMNSNLKMKTIPDGESTKYTFHESIQFVQANSEQIFQIIKSSNPPISVVVLDFILLGSGSEPLIEVVSKNKIRIVTFFSSSAAMMHICLNIHKLFEKGYLPDKKNDIHIDSSTIPGIPVKLHLCKDIPEDPLDATYKSMLSLRPALMNSSCILINTFDALERQSLQVLEEDGFKVVPLGPLGSPHETDTGNSGLMEWLSKQELQSVIFISFGTMHQETTEQMGEISKALGKLQNPFLWVLKHVPPTFLEDLHSKTKGKGMVVDWVPQKQVLYHASIGVFLTHCGWNSTIESIEAGVPMVGWPQLADQFINSKYMMDVWGLGTRLETKEKDGNNRFVGSNEITTAIESVMGNEQIRKKASKSVSKQGRFKSFLSEETV